jgi:DNA-binding transcriptional ArsR family regulator
MKTESIFGTSKERILWLLGNPLRYRIVQLLKDSDLSTSNLVDLLNISYEAKYKPSNVSRELQILMNHGVVTCHYGSLPDKRYNSYHLCLDIMNQHLARATQELQPQDAPTVTGEVAE